MRVLVTNQVILNGGDAAIALGLERQLVEALGAGCEVTFADSNPTLGAKLYPEVEFRPLLQRRLGSPRGRGRIGRAVREANLARFLLAARHPILRSALLRDAERAELEDYERFDAVVSTGGTYLVEHYDIWPRLAELRVVIALGKPLVLFTQSLGPFEAEYNRRWVRRIAGAAAAVLVRDSRSVQNLLDLGVAVSGVHRVPDVVFATPPPGGRPGSTGRAVISVREWQHTAGGRAGETRYESAMAAAATSLVVDHHKRVTFVSTCQGVDGYRDDSAVASRIAAKLSPEVQSSVTVDREQRRPEQLQELLAAADVAVCTRMHMAILALTVETPVLAVAYEFKTTELFDGLDMGDRVLDIDTLTAEEVVEALGRLLRAPELPEAVAVTRRAAHASVEILRRTIPH